MNIYVGNMHFSLTNDDVFNLFTQFGSVVSAKIINDKETGRSKGFGFVDMPNSVEAKDAIESMNDISLGKKPLVVKEAEERNAGARPGMNRSPNTNGGYNKPGFNNDRNKY